MNRGWMSAGLNTTYQSARRALYIPILQVDGHIVSDLLSQMGYQHGAVERQTTVRSFSGSFFIVLDYSRQQFVAAFIHGQNPVPEGLHSGRLFQFKRNEQPK